VILKIILLIVVAFVLYRVLRAVFLPEAASRPKVERRRPSAREEQTRVIEDEMVQDPHCGAYLPRREAIVVRRGGQDFCFCSRECRDAFLAKLRREK
jgi:YHS domain-containing protein